MVAKRAGSIALLPDTHAARTHAAQPPPPAAMENMAVENVNNIVGTLKRRQVEMFSDEHMDEHINKRLATAADALQQRRHWLESASSEDLDAWRQRGDRAALCRLASDAAGDAHPSFLQLLHALLHSRSSDEDASLMARVASVRDRATSAHAGGRFVALHEAAELVLALWASR